MTALVPKTAKAEKLLKYGILKIFLVFIQMTNFKPIHKGKVI